MHFITRVLSLDSIGRFCTYKISCEGDDPDWSFFPRVISILTRLPHNTSHITEHLSLAGLNFLWAIMLKGCWNHSANCKRFLVRPDKNPVPEIKCPSKLNIDVLATWGLSDESLWWFFLLKVRSGSHRHQSKQTSRGLWRDLLGQKMYQTQPAATLPTMQNNGMQIKNCRCFKCDCNKAGINIMNKSCSIDHIYDYQVWHSKAYNLTIISVLQQSGKMWTCWIMILFIIIISGINGVFKPSYGRRKVLRLILGAEWFN